MPIKITVPFHEKDEAKQLGAWWSTPQKTWQIQDTVTDINPFAKWLPKDESFIVNWPYIVAQASQACWKCGQETPLIALGAKSFYSLEYEDENTSEWIKKEGPVFFTDIILIDASFATRLQEQFPFFQLVYSHTVQHKYWANTCVHCQSLQGDFYNFMEPDGAFSPLNPEGAQAIETECLQLPFDYYIQADIFQAESNEWIIK